MDGVLTIGGVAVLGFIASLFSFLLGFCVKARLFQRQIDELITVIKRPPTLNTQYPTRI